MEKPTRFQHEHEKKYDWLPILLEAYYQNDLGTYNEMQEFLKNNNKKIACHKGCLNCCLMHVIPITEIEFIGISWYISEIINAKEVQNKIKEQMENHKANPACPFLVKSECSIYPLRPIACREFHVIGNLCAKDEDIGKSRPNDIWAPSREVAKITAMELLNFYGFKTQKERLVAFNSGYIDKNTQSMHTVAWDRLVKELTDSNAW